jgi:Eukaryotic membrane protein family
MSARLCRRLNPSYSSVYPRCTLVRKTPPDCLLSLTPKIVIHSMMLIYQLTSLNVAINAYDNSLLTLLLSNQFVEIKGSVFKKFEKDNLFQITCAGL